MSDYTITDIIGRRLRITNDPMTTAPLHEWAGQGDGHNCADCPSGSIWRCDESAHRWACECDARDDGATVYHGGNPDGCPREAAHYEGILSSPNLCIPCLHGCCE